MMAIRITTLIIISTAVNAAILIIIITSRIQFCSIIVSRPLWASWVWSPASSAVARDVKLVLALLCVALRLAEHCAQDRATDFLIKDVTADVMTKGSMVIFATVASACRGVT